MNTLLFYVAYKQFPFFVFSTFGIKINPDFIKNHYRLALKNGASDQGNTSQPAKIFAHQSLTAHAGGNEGEKHFLMYKIYLDNIRLLKCLITSIDIKFDIFAPPKNTK